MKLIFENWRKHTNKKLLTEIELSYYDVLQSLHDRVEPIISGHSYDIFGPDDETNDLSLTDQHGLTKDQHVRNWHGR